MLTNANILQQRGIEFSLLKGRLRKQSLGDTRARPTTANLEQRMQQLVHWYILELTLPRPSHRSPLREGNDDIVWSLR